MTTVITFGTFDVFHVGHLNILTRAKALGDRLVVGVSTDALNLSKKNRVPVFNQQDRREIVASLKCVDEAFFEESLEKKREYIEHYQASILVMGDDWQGKFDDLMPYCRVIYFPRTPSISTTSIIEVVQSSSPLNIPL